MGLVAALLGLILLLVIIGVLFWGIQTILAKVPIAEPFATIIYVVIVVVGVIIAVYVVIWLLNIAGVHVSLPHLG